MAMLPDVTRCSRDVGTGVMLLWSQEVLDADKGVQCTPPGSLPEATQTDPRFFNSAWTQTEAAFPESEDDALKAGVCCEICCKFFIQKGSADRHWKLYHAVKVAGEPQKPYHCSYCPYSSYMRRFVQEHERTHSEEAAYACRFSPQRYPLKRDGLANEAEHNSDKNPHVCGVCKKRFPRKDYLVRHERVHTGERPYACSICQKRFFRNCHLVAHAKVHTGEKPYTCRFCLQRYVTKTNWEIHERSHTNDEKPHACDVCQKRFSRKECLVSHRVVHTCERAYECDVCQKRFTQRTSLAAHKKRHMEPVTNLYSCSVCKESFSRKRGLVEHKRRAHISVGEKPYACIVCHKTFPQKMGLLNHHCPLMRSRMFAASVQNASLGELS